MLLRAGAKPSLMDMEGKNALDYAESAEFDDVVAMLAACDDGPSICSTFRDGTEPSLSQRAGTARLGGGGAQPASPAPQKAGAMSQRMTPRIPNAGEVSLRLTTPRAPKGSPGSATGRSSFRTPAYRGGVGKNYDISPVAMGSLERDKMLYLAKKLVHLSILLEQDTVTEDYKYPSFYSPPPQITLPRT